jgi:hypothetical protein
MARDGSGTYARTQSDYIFNTIIDQAKINSELNDFATEITNSALIKMGKQLGLATKTLAPQRSRL